MLSGQVLLFGDLVLVDKKSFEDIKQQIFKNFKRKKKEIVENEILSIYNLNYEFLLDALQKPIPNPFIHTILEKISNFKLGTNILLVRFKKTQAVISEINEDGIFDFRDISFHTIGSGSIQASNTLLFQKHSKKESLNSTVYNVYKAKRNAEVMQGVGSETDIFILTEEGVKKNSDEKINILKDIYEKELRFGKDHNGIKGMDL